MVGDLFQVAVLFVLQSDEDYRIYHIILHQNCAYPIILYHNHLPFTEFSILQEKFGGVL